MTPHAARLEAQCDLLEAGLTRRRDGLSSKSYWAQAIDKLEDRFWRVVPYAVKEARRSAEGHTVPDFAWRYLDDLPALIRRHAGNARRALARAPATWAMTLSAEQDEHETQQERKEKRR